MVQDWAKSSDTPLLVGTNIRDGLAFDEEDCVGIGRSTLLFLFVGTHERAEKIGLTPFGEFIPLVSTVPETASVPDEFCPGRQSGAGLAQGDAPGRFVLGSIRLATPIC